jgi:hypothetical protein
VRQTASSGGTDAERTDPIRIHLVARRQERDGTPHVLGPLGGALEVARLAVALALVGCIKSQGDEAFVRQVLRVDACGLFLHATHRVANHDCGPAALRLVVRNIEVAGDSKAVAAERYVASHGDGPF